MKVQQIIVRVIIMCMLCGFVHISVYQPPAIADDTSGGKMPDKPLFRPEYPIPGEEFEDAREIMDEVIKNGNGKDDFLNDTKWEQIEQKTAEGIEWAKQIDSRDGYDIFSRIFRGFDNDLEEADEKRNNIYFLHEHIQKTLKEKEKRFYELLNTERLLEEKMKECGLDLTGPPILDIIKEHVNQSHLGRGVTATATALMNIYDFLVKSDEYGEMRVIFRRLLELTELDAYLSGLLKQYDELGKRLTTAVAQLDNARKAQGEVKHKPTGPKVPVYLTDSGKNYFCPENYFVSGAYYSDIGGGPDRSVKKLECTRFNRPGYTLGKVYRSTGDKLLMNGNGSDWYYVQEGNAIVGAYYSNNDYSIEDFLYETPIISKNNKKCTIRFRYSYKITMKGNGSDWYTCREGYYITGAYYKDDEENDPDDSVAKIQCSYFEIECK